MARVKGRDTSPERILRSALWRAGLRYRLYKRTPHARPDIVFPKSKVAIFVDGCFWHGCPDHYSSPRSRIEFWAEKLVSNVDRDRRQTLKLESEGWRVVRIWEHEVFVEADRVVARVKAALEGGSTPAECEWRVVRVVPLPEKGSDWELRVLCLLRNPEITREEVGRRKTGADKKR